MQTPWWVPVLAFAGVVVAAAIGGLAGVFGHVLTQRRTDRRESERWQRERAERREQWEREDRARWHVERRALYGQAVAAVDQWGRGATPWNLKPEHLNALSPAVIEALAAAGVVAGLEASIQLTRLHNCVIAVCSGAEAAAAAPESSLVAEIAGEGARLVRARLMDVVRADLDIEPAPSQRTLGIERQMRKYRDHLRQAEENGAPLEWSTVTNFYLEVFLGPNEEPINGAP
ncbi:hypothetical protein GCM10010168_57480 [Actinoplanes ianthinogenes]|uniref:Secreted protein n=1 Tax=Actinoplanes ianthinogenes TaxID=122358 RepID=A0ABM7M2I2_9ACTN|nr:hypothetical protein [Actinoplanes ianthinogenes]BCJ45832.1 hypothetical protein Aiant_64890 [Actinoplanes ianthinogenes]GGR31719.1 hypothetical protein GCM10010168_57480 [Actinoplanes ianthinogenes]